MFPSAFISLKPILCKKRVFYREKTRFSAFNVVFAKKNSFKRRQMLVLALVGLI